jgi:hypothetical protein
MIKKIKSFGLSRVFYSVLLFVCICGAILICLPYDSIAMSVLLALASLGFTLLGVVGIIFMEFPSFLFPIKGVLALINGLLYIVMGLFLFSVFVSFLLKDLIK